MKQEENTSSNPKISLNDFSSFHFFNDTTEVSENSFDSTPEDESPSSFLPSNPQAQEDPSLLQFDFLQDDPTDTPNFPTRSLIGSFSTFSSIKQYPSYYTNQSNYIKQYII